MEYNFTMTLVLKTSLQSQGSQLERQTEGTLGPYEPISPSHVDWYPWGSTFLTILPPIDPLQTQAHPVGSYHAGAGFHIGDIFLY